MCNGRVKLFEVFVRFKGNLPIRFTFYNKGVSNSGNQTERFRINGIRI